MLQILSTCYTLAFNLSTRMVSFFNALEGKFNKRKYHIQQVVKLIGARDAMGLLDDQIDPTLLPVYEINYSNRVILDHRLRCVSLSPQIPFPFIAQSKENLPLRGKKKQLLCYRKDFLLLR